MTLTYHQSAMTNSVGLRQNNGVVAVVASGCSETSSLATSSRCTMWPEEISLQPETIWVNHNFLTATNSIVLSNTDAVGRHCVVTSHAACASMSTTTTTTTTTTRDRTRDRGYRKKGPRK